MTTNQSYTALKNDHRVAKVDFVGGGCARVVLKEGYESDGRRDVVAPFFSTAQRFVDYATLAA